MTFVVFKKENKKTSLLRMFLCEPWFERGALVRLAGFDLQGNDAYYLMARRDDFARPEVRALVDWSIEQFQVADSPIVAARA